MTLLPCSMWLVCPLGALRCPRAQNRCSKVSVVKWLGSSRFPSILAPSIVLPVAFIAQIDLGDQMSFEMLPASATEDELTCNMEGVPTDSSNLVIKVSDKKLGRAKSSEIFT